MDYLPIKKQKIFGNDVDVISTAMEHLTVVVVTRGDVSQALYMKPIVDAYEVDQSNTYASE